MRVLIGEYTPPECDFNRVIFNFSVVSAGRQFDRLGIMYFNDTEIFRTSTAEPTASGIHWSYHKDMTNYLALFKEPQKIIFDLGNLINDIYTAPFNTTLTATFFKEDESTEPADVIIPISARQSSANAPSAFSIPGVSAANTVTLPRNARKASFTLAGCGQSAEEFWWSNVFSSETDTFDGTTLYGFSPFREVQLYIDGTLAGVAWPFPIIFTGGVVPGLWRPVVGIDAFDLREYEIDISPFLPSLSDGKSHTFEIKVAGINDDGQGHGSLTETVGSYWVVTGKIFLWLDEEGSVTTGSGLISNAPAPIIQMSSLVGTASNGTNTTLDYQIQVHRQLSFTSTIETSQGIRLVSWHQSLSFSNVGNFTDGGNVQVNDQKTNGLDISLGYSSLYSYPLWCYSAYASDSASGNYTIVASIDRGRDVQILGQPVFPSGLQSLGSTIQADEGLLSFSGTSLTTRQNGSATYLAVPSQSASYSWGSTEQDMVFAGIEGSLPPQVTNVPTIQGATELYHRHVLATNGTVLEDEETLKGDTVHNVYTAATKQDQQIFAHVGIVDMLGRGPPK